ncbi:hypothetical protein ACFORL_09225 [Legionella dresdenensis]|uniref:Uncharacterized protein n=1 Tax=Legionella dresdenensis TaxID=450200 RepID=A0ABV8CGN0_9GAMM
MYYYGAYDFLLQSQLALPGFSEKTIPADTADVTISYGEVSPVGLANPIEQGFAFQRNQTEYWLSLPTIARFLVCKGQTIIIEPAPNVDPDSITAFLLGPCLEALLKQRHLIILPGFALQIDQNAIAFTGTLGTGQAMLQAFFYKKGYSFLAGNTFALNHQGRVLSGLSHIELSQSIIKPLALSTPELRPLRPGIDKYLLPLAQQHCPDSLTLRTFYTLKMHQKSTITFSASNTNAYLQQICPDDSEMIDIYLPKTGFKLQQIVDAINQDIVERGQHYA